MTTSTDTKKKITLRTIKSFISKNDGKIFIKRKSEFDSMQDCVTSINGEFRLCSNATSMNDYNLGINGAWFVGQSRDYFESYEDDKFEGYEVYNCCGSFILAIKK